MLDYMTRRRNLATLRGLNRSRLVGWRSVDGSERSSAKGPSTQQPRLEAAKVPISRIQDRRASLQPPKTKEKEDLDAISSQGPEARRNSTSLALVTQGFESEGDDSNELADEEIMSLEAMNYPTPISLV
jgi:hypothetical protein